jgi:FecR protein
MYLRGASPFILGLMLSHGVALAQNVGNVGAANQSATGTPPNASASHALSVGTAVIHKEKIETSGEGTAQVTFLDKSTLNVGHNSSVVIDKFVYDPSAGTGEMATSMTKGVLRFVGGQVSHTNGASVKTPVATIGIRGGTMTIIFLPGGHIMVIDQFGRVDVSNHVSSQTILRPGYAVEVDGLNQPIGPPFPVPPNILAETMALLTSQHGQHGGVKHWPDDQMAARFGIGQGRLPNDPANTPGPWTVDTINLGDTFVTNRAQQQQLNGVTIPSTSSNGGTTNNNNNNGGRGFR